MSLSGQSVRGVAWTVAASVVARAVGLAGTLLLVRYLLPEEYGVVSAAAVVVASASQLSTLGIGIYLIAHPDAGRQVTFHATVIHLGLGAVALGVVLVIARPLGVWIDAPAIVRYVPWLALAVLVDRIGYVPERVLIRDLRFRVVGISRALAELTYTIVSVGAAIAGWGAYAVVAGNLMRSLVRTALLVSTPDRRDWLLPCRLRVRTLKTLAAYGLTVSAGGIAAFATRRWDNLLISRFFGPSVMGTYNLAYNLADIPAVQVGEQITDVLFASFARMPVALRLATLVRAIRLLALILFPLAVGLGAIAPTVSATFFTARWSEVAPMLTILSALSISRPISLAITSYLQAQHRPGAAALLELLSLALLVASLLTIGRLGPLWACVAVGVAFGARTVLSMLMLRFTDHVPLSELLAPLARPLLACGPMVAAILGARAGLVLLGLGRPGVALIVELTAGALAYTGAALVIAADDARELRRLIRRTRQSDPAVRDPTIPAAGTADGGSSATGA